MSPSDPPAVIAVDGGGTRCRLAHEGGGARIVVETGSANATTDFDGAVAEVRRAVSLMAARLGMPEPALHAVPAFVGLAGVVGRPVADRLAADLPFRVVRVADDRPAAVRGALGTGDGMLAHCGTGSFFAAQRGGAIRLTGGWGPVLGDEASAHWIGRRMLRAALDRADGCGAPTRLGDRLLEMYGGAAGIVGFARAARPDELAALAPWATEGAAEGDPLAVKIMQAGAAEIAAALQALGWRPGIALCLTGGIGLHFGAYLPSALASAVMPAAGEPLDGALSLARDVAAETCS